MAMNQFHFEWYKMIRKKWTDNDVESNLREISSMLGHFPSSSELRKIGRNDLACKVSKSIGFLGWSSRIGVPRIMSDSDTGWQGEKIFAEILESMGHVAERQTMRAPFDILVNGSVRVEVKAARYAEYGACKGWFYCIRKLPQADVLVLLQLDTKNFYAIPPSRWVSSNMTISRGGGKYADLLNDFSVF